MRLDSRSIHSDCGVEIVATRNDKLGGSPSGLDEWRICKIIESSCIRELDGMSDSK